MQSLAEVRFTVDSSKGCKDKTANKKTNKYYVLLAPNPWGWASRNEKNWEKYKSRTIIPKKSNKHDTSNLSNCSVKAAK